MTLHNKVIIGRFAPANQRQFRYYKEEDLADAIMELKEGCGVWFGDSYYRDMSLSICGKVKNGELRFCPECRIWIERIDKIMGVFENNLSEKIVGLTTNCGKLSERKQIKISGETKKVLEQARRPEFTEEEIEGGWQNGKENFGSKGLE